MKSSGTCPAAFFYIIYLPLLNFIYYFCKNIHNKPGIYHGKSKSIFFGLTHLSHFQSFRQNGTSAQACRYRTASFTRQLYRHQDTFRRTGQSGIHPPQLCSAYGKFTPQFRSQTFPDKTATPYIPAAVPMLWTICKAQWRTGSIPYPPNAR